MRVLRLKSLAITRLMIPFTSVTTDSRKVETGSLFIALKGDNFDGHSFIEKAIQNGAQGVICQRGFSVPPRKDLSIFQVEDTLLAYRKLGAAWRKEFSIPIVVVAGSAGKTTTKEFLAAILQGKWENVLKTHLSQNGFIGIPMTLLELKTEHEAAVIEVGIDHIGAMQEHMNLIGATASVITAIGPEHLTGLRDIPTIAREEGIALSHVAKSNGIVAINLDDPWIRPHFNTLKEGKKIPFSLNSETAPQKDLDLIQGKISHDQSHLIIQGPGISEFNLPLPLLGIHNASNLLAAVSVALGLGLTPEEIKKGIKKFQPAEGRSEVKILSNQVTVICDYYNAQPASMKSGLELLGEIKRKNPQASSSQVKSWACLGDMLELGKDEEQFHRNLATQIIDLKIDSVLLYGPLMSHLCHELEKKDFKGQMAHFKTHEDLTQCLTEGIQPQDVVLIKGSRGMRMETIWKAVESYVQKYESRPSYDKNLDSKTHA